jgi:RNA polymerase sigma-70 factor (sigma-E family)
VTFDEFTRVRLAPLLRFATMLCIDAGLAEDLVQEVLIKAHGRWEQLEALDHPDAYVRRMIVNEFVSWRRKWARIIPVSSVELPAQVPDHADAHAERDALFRRLVRLPARQRAVIVLRYYGGLTDAEIAQELDCAVGTVRSIASRAVSALRLQTIDARIVTSREV